MYGCVLSAEFQTLNWTELNHVMWMQKGQAQWMTFTGRGQGCEFHLVLWHSWLGDRKDMQIIRNMCHWSPEVHFHNTRRKNNKENRPIPVHLERAIKTETTTDQIAGLTLKQFGRCIRRTAAERPQLRVLAKLVAEAKVGDFYVEIGVQQEILSLKVINVPHFLHTADYKIQTTATKSFVLTSTWVCSV